MYKPDSAKLIFAQNMELFCRVNNLTHVDAAACIGVSEATFNNWIRGRALPKQPQQRILEKIFKTNFKRICSYPITLRLIQDITYTAEDIFPYNCIMSACNYRIGGTSVITQYEDAVSDDFNMDYKDVTLREFYNIFSENLNYREQSVIEMRYRDSMTLDEVGKKLNLTRERIRQIEAKGLRKIYRAVRLLIQKKQSDAAKLDKLTSEVVALRAQLTAKGIPVNEESSTLGDILRTPIEDLDLSVRAYNCLKRARLDTVNDIVTYDDSLLRIRNLGRSSLEEVIDKIIELGLSASFKFDDEVNHFIAVSAGGES